MSNKFKKYFPIFVDKLLLKGGLNHIYNVSFSVFVVRMLIFRFVC